MNSSNPFQNKRLLYKEIKRKLIEEYNKMLKFKLAMPILGCTLGIIKMTQHI